MDERSERASAASEPSGAFRNLREALRSKTVPRGFLQEERASEASGALRSLGGSFAIQNRSKKFALRNRKINGASRSMSNQVYVGGGFASQDASKKVKKSLVL